MPQKQLDEIINIGTSDTENNSTEHTDENTVIAYARQTSNTTSEPAITHALEYARRHLGRDDLTDDKIQAVFNGDRPPELGVVTDVNGNPGVEEIRIHTRNNQVDHVVVMRLMQLSDSLRDVHDVISDLTDSGATVHAVEDDLVIGPGDDQAQRVIRAAANGEKRAVRRELPPVKVSTDTWTGRPPLGYKVVDGQLRPNDEYETVCDRLERVDTGELSKRAVAEDLDTTRRTITKCLESRREMYELDE